MQSGLSIALSSDRLFYVFGWPVTNTLITEWIVMAILLIGAYFIGKNLKLMPGKIQAGIENFFEFVLDMMTAAYNDRRVAERYFPLIATIFIFIFTANLLDALPIYGTITIASGGEHVPLLHEVNADLNTPLALAIISFLVIELSGIFTLGVLKYGSKFVNFRGGAVLFAVGILEIVGNLARLISFSFRLFGTIFAGEVLLLVITYFVPYVVSVPFMAFEAFIGLLQAAVFAILTMAFIKIAIDEPHGGEHHEQNAVGAH